MGAREVLYVSAGKYLGGAELSLLALVAHLDPSRYRARVALPEDCPGALLEELQDISVPVHTLDMPDMARSKNPLALARMLFNLRRVSKAVARLARRNGSCLLHANSSPAALACAFTGKGSLPPVVWHHRDWSVPVLAGKAVGTLASAGVAVSREVGDELARFLPPRRIRVIHSGVDLELFKNLPEKKQARRALGLDEDVPLLLCASHFAPWKRHDLFLKTLKKVREKIPETQGVIAASGGSGSEAYGRASIMVIASEQSVDDTLLCRSFHPEEMPSLYSACDAMVHMAENEPLGRSIIEAVASGLPLVAADCGGPREIVGPHGVLVKPGDVSTACMEVLKMLEKRNLPRETSHRKGYRDMQRFSASECARQTMELYDMLLDGTFEADAVPIRRKTGKIKLRPV